MLRAITIGPISRFVTSVTPHFRIEMAGDAYVIVITAENLTDAAEIHELGKGIHAQVSGGPAPRLVIDFQHVRQASSATLGMLIALNAMLSRQGGVMVIAGVHRGISRVFKLTRFHKTAAIHNTREAAIRALTPIHAKAG